MHKTIVIAALLCFFSFVQVAAQPFSKGKSYSVDKSDHELVLKNPAGKELLTYRYTVKDPPEGVDPSYGRGGYIHPLQTLSGKVLTSIQPRDHYHHYGLWNPWTRVEYGGKLYDLWNIGDKQGTVRFAKFADIFQNDDKAGFEAVHEHVVFDGNKETVIVKENWRISITQLDADSYQCDVQSTLTPVTDTDVTLKEYRYAGLGFRATPEWTNTNSDVLTSTGKTRKDADGSLERWSMTSGKLGNGKGGVLFLSHPDNYNFPEPIRIWPTDANGGRGDQFFNFSPTKNKDWILKAGESYTLRYRLVIFDGDMSATEAEQKWESFATLAPPVDWNNVKVLVYTKNGKGFVHDNIENSVIAMKALGEQYGFTVDATDDPTVFTDDNLKQYDALVFSNTNNDVFDNDAQRVALMRYIQAGGGFVGIHSASGTERNWKWFKQLLGATFYWHDKFQPFTVNILDAKHPSVRHLSRKWERVKGDEFYYLKQMSVNLHVVAVNDATTLEGENVRRLDTFGDIFPSVWCHEFDGGRSWYTSLGHDKGDYLDEEFRKHILGGIESVVNLGGNRDYSKAYATSPADEVKEK